MSNHVVTEYVEVFLNHKRHLSWLEANGLIRRGDQRQAGHFSEWHRPVVWDLCHDRELPAAQVLGYAEEQGLQGGHYCYVTLQWTETAASQRKWVSPWI